MEIQSCIQRYNKIPSKLLTNFCLLFIQKIIKCSFASVCSPLIFCSSAAFRGLVSEKKAEEKTVELEGKRGRMKGRGMQKSQRGVFFFLCLFKSCLHQTYSPGPGSGSRGETYCSGRETGDISTQYLISQPSLMHPGVSSPAPAQADR